jgi:hypothetical protein
MRRQQTNNKPPSCTEQTGHYGSASLQPQNGPDQQQSFQRSSKCLVFTCRSWAAEQIKLRCALADLGASPARFLILGGVDNALAGALRAVLKAMARRPGSQSSN